MVLCITLFTFGRFFMAHGQDYITEWGITQPRRPNIGCRHRIRIAMPWSTMLSHKPKLYVNSLRFQFQQKPETFNTSSHLSHCRTVAFSQPLIHRVDMGLFPVINMAHIVIKQRQLHQAVLLACERDYKQYSEYVDCGNVRRLFLRDISGGDAYVCCQLAFCQRCYMGDKSQIWPHQVNDTGSTIPGGQLTQN